MMSISLYFIPKVKFYFIARFYPSYFKFHTMPCRTAKSVTQHRALQSVTSHSIRVYTSLCLIDSSNRGFGMPVVLRLKSSLRNENTAGISLIKNSLPIIHSKQSEVLSCLFFFRGWGPYTKLGKIQQVVMCAQTTNQQKHCHYVNHTQSVSIKQKMTTVKNLPTQPSACLFASKFFNVTRQVS